MSGCALQTNVTCKSTAKMYAYTPMIKNTVYIFLIRHRKHLLVVVYKSVYACCSGHGLFFNIYIYIYVYKCVYMYICIHYIYIYI